MIKDKISPDKSLVKSKGGYNEESFKEKIEHKKMLTIEYFNLKIIFYLKISKNEMQIIEIYLNSYKKKIANKPFVKRIFLSGQDV